MRAFEDVADENPRRDDLIGVQLPRLDQVLDLGDRHRGGGRHHRVEVARGLPVDQVPGAIALPRLDEREICAKRRLQHVVLAVDRAGLLAFRDDRAVSGRREETPDSGPRRVVRFSMRFS